MTPRQYSHAAESAPTRTALKTRLDVALLSGGRDVACCAGRRPQQRGLGFTSIPLRSLVHVLRRRVSLQPERCASANTLPMYAKLHVAFHSTRCGQGAPRICRE